jgi:ABC-type phosphate transport system substrate-binding protein
MWRHAARFCLVIVLCMAQPARPARLALAVIVHPARAVRLGREDVARIYLRKRRFWDDGAPIVALNQEPTSPARAAFTRLVLGTDTSQLQAYWNEQYFQGIFPPTVLSSADAVRRYVAADVNAIGYIEASEVNDSVRVALRLE